MMPLAFNSSTWEEWWFEYLALSEYITVGMDFKTLILAAGKPVFS